MASKVSNLKGIIVAPVIPHTDAGELDEPGLRAVTCFLLERRVNGLFPCGSTGGAPMMTEDERKRAAEVVVEEAVGKVPVVVHVGSPDIRLTVRLAKHAESIGAAALGAVPPYYYGFDVSVYERYYRMLAEATRLPMFLYHNPVAMGSGLQWRDFERLAQIERFAGIKETSGNLQIIVDIMQHVPSLRVFVGNSTLALSALLMGAHGAISAVANVAPELFVELYEACVAGDISRARNAQTRINLLRPLIKEPTITALHEGLKLRGVPAGHPQLTFRPATKQEVVHLRAGLEAIQICGEECRESSAPLKRVE